MFTIAEMLVDSGGGVSSNTTPSPKNSSISSRGSCGLTVVKPVLQSPLKVSPNDKPPAVMDVHARLASTPPHVLIRSISSLSHTSIRPLTPETEEENMSGVPAVRKGILLQARDRLFSRWKERYFLLTRDYLACFRRGSTKYSEMGSFIFKVNLATVDYVGWEDRRGGPVLSIALPREGKMLLRAKIGLDQWYRDLREATAASRNRRNALKRGSSTTHLNHLGNNNLQSSLQRKVGNPHFNLSDSTPEIVQLCESVCRDASPGATRNLPRQNRYSLMNSVETGSCEGDIATPPSSVTSSHKFSSSTSSTSGSGGSSSLASSPSLRNCGVWPRPCSPVRPSLGESDPRTRFSLYEGPRETILETSKSRHSVCVEPRGLHSDIISVFRRRTSSQVVATSATSRHSICVEPRDIYRCSGLGSRTSLCLQPRNPLLELLESNETNTKSEIEKPTIGESNKAEGKGIIVNLSKESSPAKSEPETIIRSSPLVPIPSRDGVDTSPSPPAQHRPRSQSTSVTTNRGLAPRSRTNLALFRNSALFN